MGYIERTLTEGERIVYRAHLHGVIYARPVAILMVGIALMAFAKALAGTEGVLIAVGGLLVTLAGVVGLLRAWIRHLTTEIAATTRRFVVKRGLVRRNAREIQAWQIESVVIDQSILGRLLDFGSIVVAGTGASLDPVKPVAAPLELRKAIDQIAEAMRMPRRPQGEV